MCSIWSQFIKKSWVLLFGRGCVCPSFKKYLLKIFWNSTPKSYLSKFFPNLKDFFSFRDFALNDGKTPVTFNYLKYPGSFRASLSQVSNETWYSFYQAHKGMYRIKLTTGQVKNHLKRALDALFKVCDNHTNSLYSDFPSLVILKWNKNKSWGPHMHTDFVWPTCGKEKNVWSLIVLRFLFQNNVSPKS